MTKPADYNPTTGLQTGKAKAKEPDPIDNPPHYLSHPTGIECKDIVQEFSYNVGTAMAYLWRANYKNGVEDLEKAMKHIGFEIERLRK
jgi:hypothetical protein